MRSTPFALAATVALSLPALPAQANWLADPQATRPGRLPVTATPLEYDVHLRPDVGGRSFKGTETIRLDVPSPTVVLVLHANDLKVWDAKVDGQAAKVALDAKAETLTIRLAQPLAPGQHQLSLAFAGHIGDMPRGLHAQPYKDHGQDKVMLSTELEPTDARRIFPLWDEPAQRAVFKLAMDVPATWSAVSNMPVARQRPIGGGWSRFDFQPTPRVASYLLVLCAGELESIGTRIAGVDVNVVTTKGKSAQGRYALEVATQLLPYYNQYFGKPYPLPKLDLIAHPGGYTGAMENWGGITFYEARLLHDPRHDSLKHQQDVYSIIAHELAHQWFGNLVTMAWWDELWLNEGFASWMETKATDHFNPTWRMWLDAGVDRERAMALDARPSTHAIQQPVVNASDADAAFDDITYQKGQAFIRMLENYLGEVKFRDGIRRYMATHAFGNTTTDDLWRSLASASGQPVERIADPWITRPGFPLLEIGAKPDGVAIRQSRYTDDGKAVAAAPWQVPAVFAFNGRPASILVTAEEVAITTESKEAFKANWGDGGYYRVKYDAPLFARLKAGFAQLPTADQAGLLTDTWALVQARRAAPADWLALVGALRPDADPAVWARAVSTFDEIRELEADRPGRAAFARAARGVLAPVAARLGWEPRAGESPSASRLRPELIALLGRLDDPTTVATARHRFTGLQARPTSLHGDLREAVVELYGRSASPLEHQLLLGAARRTETIDERQVYYKALGDATNPKLAQRALDLTLGKEVDPFLALGMLRHVSWQHPLVARAFVVRHRKALFAGRTPSDQANLLKCAWEGAHDAASATSLERFSKAHVAKEAWPEISRDLSRMRFEDAVRREVLPAIERWAGK